MRSLFFVFFLLLSAISHGLKFEAGTITLPNTGTVTTWTQVAFQQSYDTVPIIFSIITEENPDPVTVRIRNVTMSGFEIAQFEPDNEDGVAVEMTVGYMAIEEGVHVLPGGAQLEVGTVTTDLGQGRYDSGPTGWTRIYWLASYTGTPGIITQLQTMNSTPAPVLGATLFTHMAVAIDRANTNYADITIERGETYGTHTVETMGYMAIQNGETGTLFSEGAPGVLYETMVTPKTVRGWSNGCFRYNFTNTYTSIPFLVGAQNDRAGGDGGFLRRCSISLTQVGFSIDEDRARDAERAHTTEIVAAVIYEEPFYFDSDQSTCSGTHRESWDSGTYTSQEGSETWNTDWIEVGDDGTAGGGNLRIDSGDLLFTGDTGTGGSVTIERQFDLTDFDESYFTYSFEYVGTLDADDDVLVHVSGNGGTSWNLLYTIEGSNPNTSGLISHDITAYKAANTRVRFTFVDASGAACCFEGAKGIRIKKVDVASAANDCSNTIDHFDIDHDGEGLTCDVESITLRAVDTFDIRVFDYNRSVDISTSTGEGDWILINGAGVFTPGAANSGTATYVYHVDDAGVAEFGLSHVNTGTFSINAIDTNLVTESSGVATAANDPDIEYKSAGFRVVDAADNPLPSNMVAATGLTGIYLQAVNTNPVTQACEGFFQNTTTVDIELGTRCVDPGSCIVGQQATVTNNSVTTTLPNPQNLITGLDKIPVSLLFGPNSKAAINLNYPDVGRISLDSQYVVSPSSTMTGTAETISMPADFEIVNASIANVGGTILNPGSDAPNEAKFLAAGETFQLQVRVENSAGNLTPNFGNEATPESIDFIRTHIAPTGGTFTNGSLGSIPAVINMSASGGLLSFTGSDGLTYSEVGAITLKAEVKDSSYLDEGNVISVNDSATIGRFHPNNFVVTSSSNGSWESSCNALTPYVYAGDAMRYDLAPILTIAARNVSNSTTINYQGAWQLLTGANFTEVAKTRNDANTIDISLTQNDGSITDNSNGTLIYTLSATDEIVADHFSVVPYEPTSLSVELQFSEIKDSDDVTVSDLTAADVTPTASQVRFGRLIVKNAIGPDDRDLTIPIEAEYYLGGTFMTNVDDSCTDYDSVNFNLGTPTPPAVTTPQGSGTFSAGIATTPMELTATNTFTAIPFDYVVPAAYLHLKYDWDADGDNDEDPGSKATFGLYEGRKPVIFQREVIGR